MCDYGHGHWPYCFNSFRKHNQKWQDDDAWDSPVPVVIGAQKVNLQVRRGTTDIKHVG